MAWKECKIAFRNNASIRIGMEKKKRGAVNRILETLSQESEIPYQTLKNWYYEKDNEQNKISTENGTNTETTENIKEIEKNKNNTSESKPDYTEIICAECNKNPVYLRSRSKKPYGPESKYFGLCGSCRGIKEKIIALDKLTDDTNGIQAVCPACGTTHYINRNRIKN